LNGDASAIILRQWYNSNEVILLTMALPFCLANCWFLCNCNMFYSSSNSSSSGGMPAGLLIMICFNGFRHSNCHIADIGSICGKNVQSNHVVVAWRCSPECSPFLFVTWWGVKMNG
jgi:hypothetical protein